MGVKVKTTLLLLGDNLGVIQNATMKDSLLKKKHVALSFHKSREATITVIVHALKMNGKRNYSDALTKALPLKAFNGFTGAVFHG